MLFNKYVIIPIIAIIVGIFTFSFYDLFTYSFYNLYTFNFYDLFTFNFYDFNNFNFSDFNNFNFSDFNNLNTYYGLNSDGTVRKTLSQMSLDHLKLWDYYSKTGYTVSDASDLLETYSNPKYKLVYGNINGASQYYFLNSNNEAYALIEGNLQSKAEYLYNFKWR